MFKESSTLLLLLAVVLNDGAHAGSLALNKGEFSPLMASTWNIDNTEESPRVKREVSESTVEDWSLTCSQLCGAGLGGPLCDPHCKNLDIKVVSFDITEHLLGSHQTEICDDLCTLSLGKSVCKCQMSRMKSFSRTDRNIVCNSFCENNGITLNGCSPCSRTDVQDISTPSSSSEAPVSSSSSLVSSSPTTPNWDEICVHLCKIGEGGVLCNCDIPPFF